jgi:hypothetical protein
MARRRRVQSPRAISPRPFIGMSMLVAALFLYGWSVVAVPWYVSVPLLLVWALLMLLSLTWWSVHPDRLPWVAVLAFVVWLVVIVGGGLAFGWLE